MATNNVRKDPYRNFNFRVAAAAAVAGVAAFVIVRALSARRPDAEAEMWDV
jgi:hypothetical protein